MNIDFRIQETGISDAVAAVQAACGMAYRGHIVTFHSRHHLWFKGLEHMNLTIAPEKDVKTYTYTKGMPRPTAYTQSVIDGEWHIAPPPVAALPQKINPPERLPDLPEKYVLLAPFSSTPDKEWSVAHWRMLVDILNRNGRKSVVTATSTDQDRLRANFSGIGTQYFWGQKPDWVVRAIAHADLVVGNHSAIAAVAGLYRRPTVMLCAQYQDDLPINGTTVALHPPKRVPCAPCNGARLDVCKSCSALQLISPFDVADQVLERIEGVQRESIGSEARGGKTGLQGPYLRWVQQAESSTLEQRQEEDRPSEEGGRGEAGAVRPEGVPGLHAAQEPGAQEELPPAVSRDQRQKRQTNKRR